MNEYLPHLIQTLRERRRFPRGPFPKFCKLQVPYRPWYEQSAIASHPGVFALQQNLENVVQEMSSIRAQAHDYDSSRTADGPWQVCGLIRYGVRNTALTDKCPTTWSCIQHFDLEHSWGEVLLSIMRPYSCLPVHTGVWPSRCMPCS